MPRLTYTCLTFSSLFSSKKDAFIPDLMELCNHFLNMRLLVEKILTQKGYWLHPVSTSINHYLSKPTSQNFTYVEFTDQNKKIPNCKQEEMQVETKNNHCQL